MEKHVFIKGKKLNNVVGRVDYISNPKRQENLLGFYQTPSDPDAFWRDLAADAQEQAAYNKEQIKKHNEEEKEKFEAGLIPRPDYWVTVEARENILCLPNDWYGRFDPQSIAKFLAEDIKKRHGIECAVGVHLNKKRTNLHAHIILPERTLRENVRESIATRNTYYNAEGKRSNKSECVQDGVLKPGCRMVRKGEILKQRKFSEKDPRFASKNFTYNEKLRYAEYFNQYSKDRWTVYSHKQSPYMRYFDLKREEPAGLRAWKERENEWRRFYNTTIEAQLKNGELTLEQALEVKQQVYAYHKERAAARKLQKEQWICEYRNREAERKYERYHLRYTDSGRKRTLLENVVLLGLVIAGVDIFKNNEFEIEDAEFENTSTPAIVAKTSFRLQRMVDELCIAAGRKTPSQLLEERKTREDIQNVGNRANNTSALNDLIGAAEIKRSDAKENSQRAPRGRDARNERY